MRKLLGILVMLCLSLTMAAQIDTIQNNESGYSVRSKINQTILTVNSWTGGVSSDSSWYQIFTNTIAELTSGVGVTIDGTKIQDYSITPHSGYPGQYISADSDELSFGAGGNEVLDIKASAISWSVPLVPQVTDVTDIGSSSLFIEQFFGNFLRFKEQVAPSSPPVNRGVLYMDQSDEHLYFQNSTTIFDLTTGIGGGDTTYLHYRIDSLINVLNDTAAAADILERKVDVRTLAVFGGGNNTSGATTAFTTDAYYGTFYHDGSDTLVVTKMVCVLAGTSPSVGVQIHWHTTHGSALSTNLNSTAFTVTSTTTGNVDESFANYLIPPGVFIWCTTPTVTTAPTYMSVSLIGYKL